MSQATGTTFQMCRIFIEDEFKKSSGNQLEGSIMRGNSIATKLTKSYLSILSTLIDGLLQNTKLGRNTFK
jgi:hypothetical protein